MSVFKDFPGLKNLGKKFKDFQGPARALCKEPYCNAYLCNGANIMDKQVSKFVKHTMSERGLPNLWCWLGWGVKVFGKLGYRKKFELAPKIVSRYLN